MIDWLVDLGTTYLLGLVTPLTAVCVIPMYPGFIAFLTTSYGDPGGPESARRRSLALGLLVMAGTTTFMALVGLVFATAFQVSLTGVVEVISPIGFALLAVVGGLLVFGVPLERLVPQGVGRRTAGGVTGIGSPQLHAFGLGFFFGVLVLPCNPGLLAAFFARAMATSTTEFARNFTAFLAFGLGLGTPLLAIAALSQSAGTRITRWLARRGHVLTRAAGAVLLVLALYELLFVFHLPPVF